MLTEKQTTVAMTMLAHQAEKGFWPTQQWIADALGVSKVTVYEHLKSLERKGVASRCSEGHKGCWSIDVNKVPVGRSIIRREDAGIIPPEILAALEGRGAKIVGER